VTIVFCLIFGSSLRLQLYTPERIFTQDMSNDVVLAKEVPFGGPDDYV